MRAMGLVRWGPFVAVLVLSGVVTIDRAGAQPLATFVGELFLLLPPAAMLAVGGTRSRRGAALLGLSATLTMLTLDFAPVADAGAAGPGEQLAVDRDGVLISSGQENLWLSPGAARRIVEVLPEGLFMRGGREQRFPLHSPLVVAASSLLKLAYLLAPIGLIGWSLGLEGWMRRRVTFVRARDQVAARVVLDVGVAMFVIWLALSVASRAMIGIVLGGNAVWTIVVPFGLLFLAGLPGWLQPRGQDGSTVSDE